MFYGWSEHRRILSGSQLKHTYRLLIISNTVCIMFDFCQTWFNAIGRLSCAQKNTNEKKLIIENAEIRTWVARMASCALASSDGWNNGTIYNETRYRKLKSLSQIKVKNEIEIELLDSLRAQLMNWSTPAHNYLRFFFKKKINNFQFFVSFFAYTTASSSFFIIIRSYLLDLLANHSYKNKQSIIQSNKEKTTIQTINRTQ